MPQIVQGLFSEALKHHQAGDLAEAERFYRQILAIDARHADSLHLLGVMARQDGRHEAAVALISQAIQIRDDVPSFYNNLGTALLACNRLDEAAAQFGRAITLNPDHIEAHNNLGYALQAQGKLDEAAACYGRALVIRPDFAQAHYNLGFALQVQGKLDEAAACYERALAIKPDYARAHNNLGNALHDLGRVAEAAACYERALAVKPDFVEAYNNLGNTLQNQGKLDEATACYERALAIKPDYAEARYNLGKALQSQGRFDDAEACYERALATKPDFAEAHNNLGYILQTRNKLDSAVACYERALAIKPDYVEAHNNLGNALGSQGKSDDAVACYERALAIKPDYADAHNNLGYTLLIQGKLDEAAACYERALAIKPGFAEAHFNRADIKTFRPGDADLGALEDIVAGIDSLHAGNAIYLHFALAKALEDVGDYDRAFEHLLKGNALKRRQINYDERAFSRYLRRISKVFDSPVFDLFQGVGDPSPVPIFIVGMPRSGSTLLEQILSSHPQIHAGDERTDLDTASDNVLNAGNKSVPYLQCAPAINAGTLRQIGQDYLARLPKTPDGKVRITDKLPGNFINVGLIRLALPNARIIHAMRDPADTCVSCFSKLFRYGQEFSYEMTELGRRYRDYRELMDHWRSVLPPGTMLDVVYEDVVSDLEGQARRMIDYCGLPWDDRCLDFQKNKRVVRTASAAQVRQPLFRSSLQRWRRYESHISPLLRELGDIGRPGTSQSQ